MLKKANLIIVALAILVFPSLLSYSLPASAQIPPFSSQANESQAPLHHPVSTTPNVDIYSHDDGDQVPVGELSIDGFSSDNSESNCQVYADVNDITPMRNVTASTSSMGHSGEHDDFSRWIFRYTQDYQLIREGSNELTAKISCFIPGNPVPLSEWDTVNVTGVVMDRSEEVSTEQDEERSSETNDGEEEED
jgi:hypothetical protein